MFDLYQYLPRSVAARLARNGSQTSFIPDVFARAAEQIRRIPSGGRAASPTDRLTLRVSSAPPPPRVFFALLRARSPYPLPSWSRVESSYLEPGCSARSIGRHNKKSKRQEILYARSTARGELHSNGCAAVPRFPPTPLGFPIRPSLASPPEPWMFLAEEISRRTRDSVR